MVARFTQVGKVSAIEEARTSGSGIRTNLIYLDVEDESYPVLLQGKVCSLIEEDKLKIGDTIYVEGRIKKDRAFTASAAKAIVLFFATYISVLG